MLRSATAGQALAADFLRLEAHRDALEGKQLRCLEDMENRKQVNQQRRKAYADILDRRLRAEGTQQSFTKERNLVIRTEATRLCSSAGGDGEAVNQIRASKERFALEVEQMWQDWQQRVATKIREDIDVARRDAEHCKARQQEAMEVALTQERLLVDLLEAEFLAQKEREKLYEEVEEQQQRLRQRLRDERRALDERLQAFTAGPPPATSKAPGTSGTAPLPAKEAQAAVVQQPQAEEARTAPRAAPTAPVQVRQAPAEAPVTASKACGQAASGNTGFVPKAGTRHFEVYQQLRRNEMEMQADLRLLEDRQVLHCMHCGSTRLPPGSPTGLCEACGHFTELIQLPPQVARGPALRLNATQPRTSEAVAQALRLRPPPPALASRGPAKTPASETLASHRAVTQPNDVALLLGSRPCASRSSPMESRLIEARELYRPESEASLLPPTMLPTMATGFQPDIGGGGADFPDPAAPMAEEAEAPERELEMPAMQAIAEASGEKKERTSSKVIEDAISAGLLPSQRPVQDEALGREKKRPVDLGAPAEDSGILGSLGILEVPLGPPLAPLQQQPKAAPPAIASVARSGDNDWYGSSTSGTPRKEEEEGPKIAAPASESSAEDLHFPSRQLTPREDNEKPLAAENQRPAAATEVAENTTPASDPTPERQTRMPERIPVQQEEAEDTEEADLDAMIPFSAREKAQRQISPLVQVVEQPQVPNDPRKSKEAAKSPEGSSLGSLASPEALQDASAGSFSFGEQGHNGLGEASPLQVMPAKGDVGASPASKASVPAPAANTANSGVPAARPTPTILRDLGLDESSEDTPRTDSKEAAKASPPAQPALASPTSYSPASSKALPKRSNPLARVGGGRGNLLQGSGGDFLGGGMAGLGLPGSRDVGSGGALSSLAALRPKAKARPKIGSLPGGPIDWSQKEDFK